jgi:hypothetical protein
VDGGDLAAGAVLDTRLSGRAVLLNEGDEVSVADAVVDVGQLRFAVSEFTSLCAEVLRTGVKTVDLLVRGVCRSARPL